MRRLQQGLTLVEMVIAIIVISIAVSGVLMVMAQTVRNSADPMLTEQAVAIAEAYMEEIMVKEYADPDGAAALEASRDLYDDVDDYVMAAHSPSDQLGGATPAALAAYSVTVAVDAPALRADVTGVTQLMKHISVTVTHTTGVTFTLHGYRAVW